MGKKVLLVDDEESIRQYLAAVLEDNGYESVNAKDGMEGLSKAREERPDLIVLDVMMPKKNGISTIYDLKRSHDLKDIPVIMLSAVQNFIAHARKEINNKETLKQMEGLLDNVDSKAEKLFLRFSSYRHILLDERERLIAQYKKKEEAVPFYIALPDIFIDKPVDPDEFIQVVNGLIGSP